MDEYIIQFIRQRMKDKGITVTSVAKRYGVNRSTMTNWLFFRNLMPLEAALFLLDEVGYKVELKELKQ